MENTFENNSDDPALFTCGTGVADFTNDPHLHVALAYVSIATKIGYEYESGRRLQVPSGLGQVIQ